MQQSKQKNEWTAVAVAPTKIGQYWCKDESGTEHPDFYISKANRTFGWLSEQTGLSKVAYWRDYKFKNN